MTKSTRAERLDAGLTGAERVSMFLADFKADRTPDPMLLRRMPDEQSDNVARRIGLIKAFHTRLGLLLMVYEREVRELRVRVAWYGTLLQWSATAWSVRDYLALHDTERITESEWKKREQEARAETLTTTELAEYLVDRNLKDGTTHEGSRHSSVREAKGVVEKLLSEGVLQGEKRGRTTRVAMGSVYDWLGEPAPVSREWGFDVEVVPDSRATWADHKRRGRHRLEERLSSSPTPPLPDGFAAQNVDACEADEVMRTLRDSVSTGLREVSSELLSVQVVVGEFADALGGEDPLVPAVRALINEQSEELRSLGKSFEEMGGVAVTQTEPEEGQLATLRTILDLS